MIKITKIIDGIDTDIKELLVDSLENSTYTYKEFKQDNSYFTNNHRLGVRWDLINDSLAHALEEKNFPHIAVRKGFWELLLFCDKNNGYLFSVMRQNRFNYICNNPRERAPKYFEALVSLNNDLTAKVSQVTFDGYVPYFATNKNNQLESLCKNLPSPKNKKFTHIVVVFDVMYDDISSVKLYVVNNKFEIVEEVDIYQQVISARIPVASIDSDIDNDKSNSKITQRGLVKLKKSVSKIGQNKTCRKKIVNYEKI